jgi:hypothetical protein
MSALGQKQPLISLAVEWLVSAKADIGSAAVPA